MDVIFTEEAKRDLDELRRYLEPLSPAGLANVVSALDARVRSVADNPGIGRATTCAKRSKQGMASLFPTMCAARASLCCACIVRAESRSTMRR